MATLPAIGTVLQHKLTGERWIVVGHDVDQPARSFSDWWHGVPRPAPIKNGKIVVSDGKSELVRVSLGGGMGDRLVWERHPNRAVWPQEFAPVIDQGTSLS